MDAETFKKVFLPYHQKLYRIAFRITQSKNQAEDIVQETYIKLWERRNDLNDIENTEAYSIIILRNNCLDFLRSSTNRRSEEFDPNMNRVSDISIPEQLEIKETVIHVKGIIDNLPEQQRQVLTLKDWDGYSNEEIELITGLSAINIRVILSRARKSVRDNFIRRHKE